MQEKCCYCGQPVGGEGFILTEKETVCPACWAIYWDSLPDPDKHKENPNDEC